MIRKIKTWIFFAVCWAMVLISVSSLFMILAIILINGWTAIDIDFLTQESREFGEQGGIFYQIVGTLILIVAAALISLPIALCTAIYQSEYLGYVWQRVANIVIYALNGVPTILFGLFGYIVFGLYCRLGISWLTGSFILAIMILPTLVVSIKEAIESIPLKYREAGLALGFSQRQLIWAVIIPQSFFGIITGLLLGLARAAGETAAIMFTATTFSGATIPTSATDSVASLQTHILVLSQEALDPVARTNAWGAALVLVSLVFILNLGAMWIRTKFTLEAER